MFHNDVVVSRLTVLRPGASEGSGGGSHCSQTMACPSNALSSQSFPTPLLAAISAVSLFLLSFHCVILSTFFFNFDRNIQSSKYFHILLDFLFPGGVKASVYATGAVQDQITPNRQPSSASSKKRTSGPRWRPLPGDSPAVTVYARTADIPNPSSPRKSLGVTRASRRRSNSTITGRIMSTAWRRMRT